MVLHGLKRIFQKPSPELTSSERTNQLRSKTIYSGTVELSHELTKPGSNRYKTYNGPFEVVNKNGNGSLVASASYRDLLDITKGKVLLNQLPLNDLTYPYYEKNFGNGEIYVGNYQQFDGSFFNGSGPTGCADSVLIYDISTTGFTGPGSYNGNSIGNTGPSGTVGSNQDIFIDPKHCYYSDPCNSNNSYMKFVDINFKGPTGAPGPTGITGPSQYYAQQIINGNQYNGFRFPMSNFTLTCKQLNLSQTEGPHFCPFIITNPLIFTNSTFTTYYYDALGNNLGGPISGGYAVYNVTHTIVGATVLSKTAQTASFLCIGGGGGGGSAGFALLGGGGGGGGYLNGNYTFSSNLPVLISVGLGGAGGVHNANNSPPIVIPAGVGGNTSIDSNTAFGGGKGGGWPIVIGDANGGNGGCGGGAVGEMSQTSIYTGGTGTPPGQGGNGANGDISSGAGGGGGGAGASATSYFGGIGISYSPFNGLLLLCGGGGASSVYSGTIIHGIGGSGGGGNSGTPTGFNGTNGLGGGGGGSASFIFSGNGGNGGSGILILTIST